MSEDRTTAVVQRYLNELGSLEGDAPSDPIIRDLLATATQRLHVLCGSLLFRSYPRLAKGPLNLQSDELLGALVERLMRAMRSVRPQTVRQFFALAGQHIRWELNDLARRLDQEDHAVELRDSLPGAPRFSNDGASSNASANPNMRRILEAIENLPEAEREAFTLVRIQGMTQPEAASILGISSKTVHRRISRGTVLLAAQLGDILSSRGSLDDNGRTLGEAESS